jgi:hypothetical protein
MPVDRKAWAESFTDVLPHWRCPTCGKGHLAIDTKDLTIEETGPSKAAHDHEAWEPDWIENRFVGLLRCSLPDCRDLAAVSGSSSVDYYQVDWDEFVDSKIFKIAAITPAPLPIGFPDNTPEPILGKIQAAASLIWSSPESAANQIRQSVELLMDDAGVKKVTEDGKPIFLHKRIEEFSATDEENGQVLLATKWLGNTGSHAGEISRDDVLDAFDMIEFVLENRYGTAKAELLAKVAAVNAAKGPAPKSE